MTENFPDCLAWTLVYEGGWSDNPADPGGATMKGITQKTYDSYRDRKGLPRQSVRLIADYELEAIYRHDFWNACSCDQLPGPVDLSMFDAAVNVGPGRSAKWLQRAVNVTPDGVIGPATISAVLLSDSKAVAEAHSELRRQYYESIGGPFLQGWLNRVDALEAKIEEA